jgi:hypothetical protein
MFEWFKERSERAHVDRAARNVPAILSRYSQLLEKHPTAYMDETWLPVSKAEMKNILKVALMSAKNDDRREVIKICWTLLSKFQKGIGKIPIDCTLPGNSSYEEGDRIMEPYLRIAKIAKAEEDLNRTEILEFIRQSSNKMPLPRPTHSLRDKERGSKQ